MRKKKNDQQGNSMDNNQKKDKKSKITDSTPTPQDDQMGSSPLNDELISILNEKIYNIIKEDKISNKEKNRTTEELQQLQGIITEFLDNYLLIGYTFNGTPFLLSHSSTEEKHNALVEQLRITYMNTFKNSLF